MDSLCTVRCAYSERKESDTPAHAEAADEAVETCAQSQEQVNLGAPE